jgi:hypothetical protein
VTQTYNGSARPVTVTTVPSGLAVNVTYRQRHGAVNAGSTRLVATVADPTRRKRQRHTQRREGMSTITWSVRRASLRDGAFARSSSEGERAGHVHVHASGGGHGAARGQRAELQATFTPTDTANYATATKSVTLSVAKAPLIAQAATSSASGRRQSALDISYSASSTVDTVVTSHASTASTRRRRAVWGPVPITLSGGSDAIMRLRCATARSR